MPKQAKTIEKVLRIHKSLLLNEVSDDIVPIIFDYLGDVKESPVDLVNRFSCKLICSKTADNKLVVRGHYCTVCDKYLRLRTKKALARHIRSDGHKSLAELGLPISICDKCIKDIVGSDWDWWNIQPKYRNKSEFIHSLRIYETSYNFRFLR